MRHRRPLRIDVAAEVEPVVDRGHAALVHAVDGSRRTDRRFHLPVALDERTGLRKRCGVVGEELPGEHPVEESDISRRGFTGGEATDGPTEPVGHGVPGFSLGRRQGPVEERLKQSEIGQRRPRLVVGDHPGDAEPTLLPHAVVGRRQRHAAGGREPRARWEVGVEVGCGDLGEHPRDAVFQRRQRDGLPLRSRLAIEERRATAPFIEDRVLRDDELCRPLPTGNVEADPLAGKALCGREAENAGEPRGEGVSVVACRQEIGNQCVPFEGDAHRSGGHIPVGHPLPFRDPARRQPRPGEVNQRRKTGIGLVAHGAGGLPLRGGCLPAGRDRYARVGPWLGGRLEQLGQGITDVVDRCGFCPIGIGLETLPERGPQERQRLAAPGGGKARLDLATEALEFGDRRCIDARKGDVARRPPRRHEHPRQRVIVFLRNRIELVIVAAGTAHGHRQKGLGEGIDLVVDHLLMDAVEIEAAAVAVLAEMKEHRSDQARVHPRARVEAGLGEEITGDMLADELVEADSIVERPHEVVAVVPRAPGGDVPFVAVGVGVADDIHPVPGELLAEMGGGEEGINDVGQRSAWRDRGVERRWQAGEEEREAAPEDVGIGRGRRGDSGCVELRADETIDRIELPGRIGHARGLGQPGRLEAPPGSSFGEFFLPDFLWGGLDRAGIGGAAAHPVDEMGALLRRDDPLGGHLQLGVGVADRLHKERFFGSARNDRRSLIPPAHPATAGIEGEASFDLRLVGVAGEAAGPEDGEDGVGEELLVGGGKRGELRCADGTAKKPQDQHGSGPRPMKARGAGAHHSPPGGGTASLAR